MKENIYKNYLKIFIVKNHKFKFALKKIYNQQGIINKLNNYINVRRNLMMIVSNNNNQKINVKRNLIKMSNNNFIKINILK